MLDEIYQDILSRQSRVRRLILNQFQDEQLREGVVISDESFQKAVEVEKLEVFSDESIKRFCQDIQKAHGASRLKPDELEKAKKDLSKLVKVTKMDKNGKKVTVWVKRGEEPKKERPQAKQEEEAPERSSDHQELLDKKEELSKKVEVALKSEKDPDKRAELHVHAARLKKETSELGGEKKEQEGYKAGDQVDFVLKNKEPKKEEKPKSEDKPKVPKKSTYESHTKTPEESKAVIARQKSLLTNPKSPAGAKRKAQEIIDAEEKKFPNVDNEEIEIKEKEALSGSKLKSKRETNGEENVKGGDIESKKKTSDKLTARAYRLSDKLEDLGGELPDVVIEKTRKAIEAHEKAKKAALAINDKGLVEEHEKFIEGHELEIGAIEQEEKDRKTIETKGENKGKSLWRIRQDSENRKQIEQFIQPDIDRWKKKANNKEEFDENSSKIGSWREGERPAYLDSFNEWKKHWMGRAEREESIKQELLDKINAKD